MVGGLHNVRHRRNLGVKIKVEKQGRGLDEEKRWRINYSSINKETQKNKADAHSRTRQCLCEPGTALPWRSA